MRIAQLTSPQALVSPWADGHVERRAGLLADGLVDAGDEVTLLAAEGSRTRARLVSSPLDGQPDLYALVEHLMGAGPVIRGADVVHDHTDVRALITAVNGHPWIVHTLRNSSNGDDPVPADLGRINLVAPTHRQAIRHSGIDFAAVIHDGIRIDDHPLVRHRDGYLAYLGPASPAGGALIAIAVAELLGRELVLALDVRDDVEHDYWRETLAPRVRDASVRVRLMSFTDRSERHAVLGRARALLMPAPLDGDHGLLTVETGALGTPVVVFDRDGVEEFVADGVTGFVVPAGDAGGMADAVDRADTIDPEACRSWVAGRFSHEKMVGEYRALYRRLLHRPPARPAARRTTGDSRAPAREHVSVATDTSADWASTYLSVAAHDVRGPLAAIQGFVETLLAHGADMEAGESEHMLRRIGAIAARMDLTARNILDTDRIERGGLELSVEDVSLAEVWEHAMADVRTAGHRTGTDLDVPTVHADRVALERIVSNLLVNAFTHTPEGTTIVLRSWEEDGTLVLAVEDDGPGVPDDLVEAVNAPGGEHLSRSWNGGSGLGVALVRRLAELHGGGLSVHNLPGGGASFRVRLPDRATAGDPSAAGTAG